LHCQFIIAGQWLGQVGQIQACDPRMGICRSLIQRD
jgi:hypothetical protein